MNNFTDPNHKSTSDHHNKPPSSSDLLSSAKLVAEAGRSTFNNESSKVDKAKVAGAAENLLNAAEHYGKLEGSSYGKYLDKAEDYLHKYNSSHGGTTTHAAPATATHHNSSNSHSSTTESEHSSGSGGYGDYLKMAQGFMKK